VVCNITAPLQKEIAARLGDRGRARRSLPAVAPTGPPPVPATLICSGLLPPELDDVAAAYAPAGLAEADRRHDGDWSALLLRPA
jgi:ribosomal protein L11 methylase PrmA